MDQDQSLDLAERLGEVFRERLADLERWREEIVRLEPECCTGVEFWRDRDHPTRRPKLYVNHGVDQPCPVHGEPEAGGRLRVYVGSDPERIAEARRYIENETRRLVLERRVRELEGALASARYWLVRMYEALGYEVNGFGPIRDRWADGVATSKADPGRPVVTTPPW